ncbi:FAD-dependent oxidoreductase [Brevifollis gellanilyticus]|nr:FAD-dependent oxidoreductase [Brevifollis gellanilyticus]
MKHETIWKLPEPSAFQPLRHDVHTQALIIGGGITGVTAAYLLAKAGKSVLLLEKGALNAGETQFTTAHISYPTDARLKDLVKKFGHNHAEAIWDACQASAEQIRRNICQQEIDCDLRHVPGYLYTAEDANTEDETKHLKEDAELAQHMGFDATYEEHCPVTRRPAVRFSNLMKFHPTRYTTALAQAAAGMGTQICEESEATDFDPEKRLVRCNGHEITYEHIFIATHVPLQGGAGTLGAMLLQTKLAGYSTYAMHATLPPDSAPEALWWDTSDPYFYFRVDKTETGLQIIAGGQDHKTGQMEDTEKCYAALTAQILHAFPSAQLTQRWSGQVIETVDGLPYIGEYAEQFVATGYSGTGMTFGTLAAMMFADHVQGVANPWTDLFRIDRKELSSTWDYLKENKDYPFYLAKSMFAGEKRQPDELAKGEGAVLKHQGKKVAASRDQEGKLTVLSAICPHLGCVVAWNQADGTWDCPCHGSRFTTHGKVMAGPAESPLKPV